MGIIYIVLILLYAVQFRRALSFLPKNWLLLMIVGLAIVSATWSLYPEVTERRGIALFGTTAFGLYLGWRFSMREFLHVLAWGLSLCIPLSFGFAILLPDIGVMPGSFFEGAWRGAFIHKNELAYNMLWAVAVFVILAIQDRRLRLPVVVGIGLAATLIIQARSAGALVVLAALAPLLAFFVFPRRVQVQTAVLLGLGITTAILVAMLALHDWRELFQLVGRDMTLTGRVGVWDVIWAMIQDRFWLGYGYGAFWIGTTAEGVMEHLGWNPGHSHDGWLELWLNLGLIGVCLVGISFLAAFVISARHYVEEQDAESAAALIFLAMIFLTNLVESRLLQQNSLHWVIYVFVTARCFAKSSKPSRWDRSAAVRRASSLPMAAPHAGSGS